MLTNGIMFQITNMFISSSDKTVLSVTIENMYLTLHLNENAIGQKKE